jgi:GNAT superfamily N-acetyltransferase
MLNIIQAETTEHFEQARELIVQYAAALGFDIEFQDFSEELTTFPDTYSPPAGCILLAELIDQFVGCVALKGIDDVVCEMKRLYVVPKYRRKKIGKTLAKAIIEKACKRNYERMRLDTVASMKAANQLYLSLGFRAIGAYYQNPLDQAIYYELELSC